MGKLGTAETSGLTSLTETLTGCPFGHVPVLTLATYGRKYFAKPCACHIWRGVMSGTSPH